MDESWRKARGVFASLSIPPVVWLFAFFLIPLAIIWAYSFGENKSLTEIAINGTTSPTTCSTRFGRSISGSSSSPCGSRS